MHHVFDRRVQQLGSVLMQLGTSNSTSRIHTTHRFRCISKKAISLRFPRTKRRAAYPPLKHQAQPNSYFLTTNFDFDFLFLLQLCNSNRIPPYSRVEDRFILDLASPKGCFTLCKTRTPKIGSVRIQRSLAIQYKPRKRGSNSSVHVLRSRQRWQTGDFICERLRHSC